MKIAIIQLEAKEIEECASGATLKRIHKIIRKAANQKADLVVFPECHPFAEEEKNKSISISKALSILEKLPKVSPAVILGGYVMQGTQQRNASFLVHKGRVHEPYFKRVPWENEQFKPGNQLIRWSWNGFQVIPLICADVCVPWNEADGRTAQMMGEAVALGAGPMCPIIVTTFGADLRTPYWTEPLRAWARACNAPVLVSAIAGKSERTFHENGRERHFGGGGSGIYWAEGSQNHTLPPEAKSKNEGMYLIDTLNPKNYRLILLD